VNEQYQKYKNSSITLLTASRVNLQTPIV